ncbi:MAG: PKD domain-containing protein, partial [Bacteroidota bacterium]
DSYEVLVSTASNDPADFTNDISGGPVEAPDTWTEHTYDLSDYDTEDIYLAIHHVSAGKFMLWIDDMEIHTELTEALNADFTADNTTISVNDTVNFTDLSTGSPTSWNWDFGDGNTSNEQNPQHTYNSAGTYTVELIATNTYDSDTLSITDYITVYDELVVSNGSSSVACHGDTDGTLTANVSGGDGLYTYTWEDEGGSNLGDTETISGLEAGTFYLTVTDGIGFTDSGVYTVTQPDELLVDVTTTDETALGACDGTATADVTGGTPDYMYDWSPLGGMTQTITDLCAGNYQVTVVDDNGCTAIDQGEVAEGPPAPVADFEADVTEGCGSLTVQFTDLSLNDPDTWSWDFGDGSTSTEENPLHTYSSPGIYTVELTATNSYGSDTHSITDYITVYDNLVVSDGSGSCDCYGDASGSLNAIVSGGEGTYSYIWENTSGDTIGTSATISGLTAGEYHLYVTDDAGCSDNGVYTVTEPDPLVVNVSTTNESAAGACDGTATADVSGGTEPYSDFVWDNGIGSAGATVEDLWAGTFCVTATDAHGCTVSDCGTVEQGPPPPPAEFEADITEGCEPLSVQFTSLNPDNVTSWSWDFGDGETSTEQNPEHVYDEPGVFTVELTVESSVSGTESEVITDYITVLEQPGLDFNVSHESVAGANDGEITVIIEGNDDPYSISWSNGANDTVTIDNLSAGMYSVAVTGSNGCSNTGNIEVELLTALVGQNANNVAIYPNPADYMVYVESDKPIQQIDMYAVDGRLVDSWNPEAETFEISVEALNGLYMIRITDSEGAVSNHQVIVKP